MGGWLRLVRGLTRHLGRGLGDVWFLAICISATLLASFRLTTRYDYGPKSRRILLGILAGSAAVGLVSARRIFPGATGWLYYLAAAGVGLIVFVFGTLVTVEVLRKGLQRDYDERLAALRGREQSLLQELEKVTAEIRSDLHRREDAETAGRGLGRQQDEARRTIEAWKRGGGAARIRSVKLEEWESELCSLSEAELASRRSEYEKEFAVGTDPERGTHLEVLLALCSLIRGGTEAEDADSREQDINWKVGASARRRRELEGQLARVRAEIAEWHRRLSDFLSKEIPLG